MPPSYTPKPRELARSRDADTRIAHPAVPARSELACEMVARAGALPHFERPAEFAHHYDAFTARLGPPAQR